MKSGLKAWVPIALDVVHLLALAVWLGGLVTLWLAVMPAAFHLSGLTTREAEAVAGNSLRGFTAIVELCGLAMAGAQFVLRRRYQAIRRLFVADGVRQLLTFGALLLAEFNLRGILPQMDVARQQAHVAEFHALHQNYALLATLQAVILVVVGALTAWLQAPRTVTFSSVPPGEPSEPASEKEAPRVASRASAHKMQKAGRRR